jgi:hypothetical protein
MVAAPAAETESVNLSVRSASLKRGSQIEAPHGIKVPYFDPDFGSERVTKNTMSTQLKKVTIYLTAAEYAALKAEADDEGVTISAILRAKLGLDYKRRGAPEGNTNRQTSAMAKGRAGREE